MKTTVKNLIVTAGILLTILVSAAYQPDPQITREGNKAVHGVINVLTFPLEFPVQSYKGYSRGVKGLGEDTGLSRFAGCLWGFVGHGTHKATGRLWLGLYQLGGYWTLNPATNEGVGLLLDSEYAFDLDQPLETSFNNGLNMVGNKLRRGLLNVYWGTVAELPGKTVAGFSEKTPIRGILKGSWYMLSRLWQGVHDTGGFLLPNSPQTLGYVYEVDEPWRKRPEAEDNFQFSSTD